MIRVIALIVLFASPALAQLPADVKSNRAEDVPAFRVRPGYRVIRAVDNHALRSARFLQFSSDGKTLFVSQPDEGAIVALRDADETGKFKTITTFVKNKRSVQGMDFHDGWLYFSQASEGSISRARDTNGDGVADDVEVLVEKGTLPKGGGHPFEGLLVTDKAIYVTSSDPRNLTPPPNKPEQDDPERKQVYVFDFDGKAASNKRTFCTGLRNTEKLRFRPDTTDIYGIDHGSDNFGQSFGEKTAEEQPITDVNPPEELNKLVEGGFYGHPFIMGNGVPRPEFSKRDDIVQLATKTIAPEWLIHAHWAVNGFTFLTTDYFRPGSKGDLFFCSHGSWNSVHQVGAIVQRVFFDPVTGKPFGSQTIVECVNEKGSRIARPCDAAEAPDGSVIFTTDEPVAVYRIVKASAGS